MRFTRTRLILVGIVAVLVLAAACNAASDDGEEASAPEAVPGLGDVDSGGPRDERSAVLPTGEPADGESESYAVSQGDPANGPSSDPKLQGLLDRKIIQSTSIDVEVEDVGRDFQEIVRIAETAGGFVASSAFSNVDGEQAADVTIRVPGDSYQEVLAQIRSMGLVTQESSDANDVTEEYTDLQARLRTLEATEQRYLDLLAQANTIDEILTVQDRLDGVRGQIEQVQGRINMLDHLTDLGTITIHLRPPASGEAATDDDGTPRPLEAAARAWELSLDTLLALASAALAVAAFSWWLLPPLAILGVGTRWWLNQRPPRNGPHV